MNKSLVAATVLLIFSAGQAFADGACPVRSADQGAKPLRDRTHAYCEVKWGAVAGTPAAAGWTHDGYINSCARRCYGDRGDLTAGNTLTVLTGLTGIGLASYTSTLSGRSNGAPASP